MFIIGLSIIILIKDLIDPVYREMYYILSW